MYVLLVVFVVLVGFFGFCDGLVLRVFVVDLGLFLFGWIAVFFMIILLGFFGGFWLFFVGLEDCNFGFVLVLFIVGLVEILLGFFFDLMLICSDFLFSLVLLFVFVLGIFLILVFMILVLVFFVFFFIKLVFDKFCRK